MIKEFMLARKTKKITQNIAIAALMVSLAAFIAVAILFISRS